MSKALEAGLKAVEDMPINNFEKEMTKHIRTVLSVEGITARVRLIPGGKKGMQVFPTSYEAKFSEEEQKKIRTIAKANHLTLVRGIEIVIDRMTDPNGMEFYFSDHGLKTWVQNCTRFPTSNSVRK